MSAHIRTSKVAAWLFVLAQFLLVSLYILSEPDVSIQISFDSFHNLSQQQQELTHDSAASQRYLHNQSLQQLEPNNLQRFSVQQLAKFFACKGYAEHQILNKRTLYMNPAFVALVKQYKGYQAAVTNVHNELQHTSGFYKWLGRLNGYHKKGLTKQIAMLYHQLEQENQVRACTYEVNNWSELCSIYQEYGCGGSTHLYRRCDALKDIQNRGAISSDQVYALPSNVVRALRSHGHDPEVYAKVYGNQFQQALRQECIELLTRTIDLSVGSVVYDHQDALIDCIDAAHEYNQAGFVHKSSVVADLCWALLDYGSAVAEGVACGLIGAVQDMVGHPIQTVACIVAGEYVLAYQLCKIVCNVADIGVTALVNSSRAKKKWDDYIEPVSNVISAIKNKETSCRDAIKMSAGLAVGFVAQYKLFGGLGKFYSSIRAKAIEFFRNNPLLTPQEYMQTSGGSLFKAVSSNLEEIKTTLPSLLATDTSCSKEVFNFTNTTLDRMNDLKRMIPVQILKEIIDAPMYVAKDPQQATNALMHYAQIWKNKKLYNVEVLYDKNNNTIFHFLYTQKELGKLPRIK